jgi:hypothetical protein
VFIDTKLSYNYWYLKGENLLSSFLIFTLLFKNTSLLLNAYIILLQYYGVFNLSNLYIYLFWNQMNFNTFIENK